MINWTRTHLRRSPAVAAVLATVFAAGIVAPAASRADGASLTISVTSWQQSTATGAASYDFTFNASGIYGTCAYVYCQWEVDGYYKNGTTSVRETNFGGGQPYNASGVSQHFSASSQSLPEITDLYAKVWMGSTLYETWTHVADPFTAGSVALQVTNWSQNESTGVTSYDITASGQGLAAVGEPCENSYCQWQIDGYYVNGSTSQRQTSFASGQPYGPWTFSKEVTATDVSLPEVTDLHVKVWSNTSGRPTYEAWVHVADPFPAGTVSLRVNNWQYDSTSGNTTYDLNFAAGGLAAVGESCEYSYCQWQVDAFHNDGTTMQYVANLGAGQPYAPWSISQHLTATGVSLGDVTDLRIEVLANISGRPNHILWLHIADSINNDVDLSYAVAAIEAEVAAGVDPCSNLLFVQGTNVEWHATTSDQYVDCEATTGAWKDRLASLVAKYGIGIALVLSATSDAPAPTPPGPTDPPLTPAPGHLTVDAGPNSAQLMAPVLVEQSAGKLTDLSVATKVAQDCLDEMAKAGQEQTGNACESLPIFAPGSDNPDTTANDYDGIFTGANTTDRLPHYEHILLHYKAANRLSGSWKYTYDQCANRSPDWPCDEYPFLSTYEAGGDSAALDLVPSAQNSSEGGYLGAFYSKCGVSSADSRPFLVIPMTESAAPTTTYTCGG